MKVYLAARYSRHEELQEYATQLRDIGWEVTSRWIEGAHQTTFDGSELGEEREKLFEEASPSVRALRVHYAQEDWNDLLAADVVISFTEKPREVGNMRGGRHVEFGAAYALNKKCVVIGYEENVFHCMPGVIFYPTWGNFINELEDGWL